MAEPAKEFIPSPRTKDCTKKPGGWGVPMADYEYIWYSNKGEDDYPEEACLPYYHLSAQIDGLQINTPGITGTGDIIISGEVVASEVTAGGITLTSRKPFDIPHPTKEGYRLRHVCLEGPESGVYYRGRLLNTNKINIPEYWGGLVDPNTITVNLTQIRTSQDLIVDEISWEEKFIKVKSGSAVGIDCYYVVYGERSDGEKLIVEYEGKSSDDYPGDNSIYSINK